MERKRGYGQGLKRRAGPSPLSIVIIGLALVVWLTQFVPTTIYAECGYALYWVNGWFSFASLFQWMGVAIAAAIILWLVSFFDCEARKAWGEALMQGVLLVTLGFWLFAIKSFLFPYAFPNQAQMMTAVNFINPLDITLVTEPSPRIGDDDPLRPVVEFEDHPYFDPAIDKKLNEIFISEYSPTGADMMRLEACVAEQRRALAQWKLDRETLRAWYDEEFYRDKPKRPRDWREEVAEEEAREETP
ncbi:MAG TPA: hypothetical protein PKM48_10450 [Parvularculaceae bacterium]|nr:hypothetical protein [Parvularculaceae bacterium]HNS85254.1 hypothetical protein [Parvularculaceae bacterium]